MANDDQVSITKPQSSEEKSPQESPETETSYNKGREFKKRKNTSIADLIIDKISVVKEVENKYEREMVSNALSTVNPDSEAVKIVRNGTLGQPRTTITYHLPSNDPKKPVEKLWIDMRPDLGRYRLEWCPAKLSDRAYEILKQEFKSTPYGSLYDFISEAAVTKLHVCRNLFDFDMDQYLFYGSWYRRHGFFREPNGRPTYYLGSHDGSQVKAYDKKAHDNNNYLDFNYVTRFERQLTKLNLTVENLKELKDPLSRVEIYTTDLAEFDCIQARYHRAFKSLWRLEGVHNALDSFGITGPEKAKALRQIRSSPWPEWQSAQDNWRQQWIASLRGYGLYENDAD